MRTQMVSDQIHFTQIKTFKIHIFVVVVELTDSYCAYR